MCMEEAGGCRLARMTINPEQPDSAISGAVSRVRYPDCLQRARGNRLSYFLRGACRADCLGLSPLGSAFPAMAARRGPDKLILAVFAVGLPANYDATPPVGRTGAREQKPCTQGRLRL